MNRTLEALSASLAAGSITSRQLVEECLERALDPAGEGRRIYLHLDVENARRAADAVDVSRRGGAEQRPWAGIPISVTVSPVRNSEGRIVGASKIARDISERKRLEEAQRVLSREVNHRSKNLLAVVQSIIRYTVSHSPQQDFVRRINERLRALSANQDLLIER